MSRHVKIAMIVAASGCAAGLASAQPFAVYGGGATLQADFFQSRVSTFDFIDVDGDGWAVSLGTTGAGTGLDDDLVPAGVAGTEANESSRTFLERLGTDAGVFQDVDPGNAHWHLYYRRVGSGNGIRELLFKGRVQEDGTLRPQDNLLDNTDGDPFLDPNPADGVFMPPVPADGDTTDDFLNSDFASEADWNKQLVIDNADSQFPWAGEFNRGAVPYRSFDDANGFPQIARETHVNDAMGTFMGADGFERAMFDVAGLEDTTGIRMSFSASDVPLTWFLQVPETGGKFAINGMSGPRTAPTTGGYGRNPIEAVNPDGTGPTTLPDGTPSPRTNNLIDASPEVLEQVFDTALVSTPVAAVVNYGVGQQQILMSDLRTLSATGRRLNGENLMKVTRDAGSGTRNAFMNGIRLDPAWGRGENVGFRNADDDTFGSLGPEFLPSNKGGSSRLEATVRQHRLAVGHSGAERSSLGFRQDGMGNLVDLNRLDVLAVKSDLKGGTAYARPTLENVLNGGPDGYNINGPAAIATIGDPRQAPPELGGIGWRPDITGEDPANNPGDNPPGNEQAAAFLNNITRSLEAFTGAGITGSDPEDAAFTPGELLALSFVPPQAQNFIPDPAPSAEDPGIATVQNPTFNQDLQDFILGLPSADVPVTPDLRLIGDFRTENGGPVPQRQLIGIRSGVDDGERLTYSEVADPTPLSNVFDPDVDTENNFYVTQGDQRVEYGTDMDAGSPSALSRNLMRNKIAGDFDGDEARTPADVPDMLEALIDREGGALWNAPDGTGPTNTGDGSNGDFAIIEVLGDFTGDGNFTRDDIRYWADGLHLTATAGVDWDDEAGVDLTANRAEGYAAIDTEWQTLTGNLFFGSTTLATGAAYQAGDAAADVANTRGLGAAQGSAGVLAGNLVTPGYRPIGADGTVDQTDIDYVFANFGDWQNIDEAVFMDLSCDMNGDLLVDDADIAFVIETVLETELGDFNLDGSRNDDDRQIILDNLGTEGGYASGDINGDRFVDNDDLAAFDGTDGPCVAADLAMPFGVLDGADVNAFITAFGASSASADLTDDGVVDGADVNAFISQFGAGCP